MMGARRRTHAKFPSNFRYRRRFLMSVKVILNIIQHPSLSSRYRHLKPSFRSWTNISEYQRTLSTLRLMSEGQNPQKTSLTDGSPNDRIHGVTVLAAVMRPVRPRFGV